MSTLTDIDDIHTLLHVFASVPVRGHFTSTVDGKPVRVDYRKKFGSDVKTPFLSPETKMDEKPGESVAVQRGVIDTSTFNLRNLTQQQRIELVRDKHLLAWPA